MALLIPANTAYQQAARYPERVVFTEQEITAILGEPFLLSSFYTRSGRVLLQNGLARSRELPENPRASAHALTQIHGDALLFTADEWSAFFKPEAK